MAKRKATDEIQAAPSKAAKITDEPKNPSKQDDAAQNDAEGLGETRPAEKEAVAETKATEESSGVANASSSARAQDAPADNSAEHATTPAERGSGQDEASGTIGRAHADFESEALPTASTKHVDDEEAPKDQDATESEEDRRKWLEAMQLLMQLQLVIERERASKIFDTAAQREQQAKGIAKLCDLAVQPDIDRNPHLKVLDSIWFYDMGKAKKAKDDAAEAKELLDEVEDYSARCFDAFGAALLARGKALLKMADHTEQALRTHDRNVADAWVAVEGARADHSYAESRYHGCEGQYHHACEFPMRMAEGLLVEAGKLRPNPAASDAFQGYRSGGTPEPPLRSPERTRHGHEQPRHEAGSNSGSVNVRTGRDIPDFAQDVRHDHRKRLEHASEGWQIALQNFDDVRHDYYPGLQEFLHAQQRNRVKGTKTDYDRSYFLTRNRCNYTLARAHEKFKHVLELADAVDALTPDERCKYFVDELEHHVSGEIDLKHDIIWEQTAKDIEAWRDGQQTPLPASQAGSEHSQSGQTPPDWPELDSRPFRATGKQRRQIDDWQAQQEKVRASMNMATAYTDWDDSGLQCFQLWDGI